MLNVLVADGSSERNRAFRIQGQPFHVSYATSVQKVCEALTTHEWDVVFYSGYFGSWGDYKHCIPSLIAAHRAKRLRTVVVCPPVVREGEIITRSLRKAGVPALFIPFNYNNPSSHVVTPVSAEGEYV